MVLGRERRHVHQRGVIVNLLNHFRTFIRFFIPCIRKGIKIARDRAANCFVRRLNCHPRSLEAKALILLDRLKGPAHHGGMINTEYVFSRPEAWTMRDRLECALLTASQCASAYATVCNEWNSVWEPSYSDLAYRNARAAAHIAHEITRIYGR